MQVGEQEATGLKKRKNLQKNSKKQLNAKERAFEKIDVKLELKRLEEMITQLKVEYEQFFIGLTAMTPDGLYREVKLQMRKIRKSPFKKPWARYKLRTLESRFHTFNDYWQRTLKQKEEGKYTKDVFKANLRDKHKLEDAEARTKKGATSKQMSSLFDTYKRALESQTGKKQDIDFQAFQKSLAKQAKAYREKLGVKKLSFKVVVKDGKVSIKAKTTG